MDVAWGDVPTWVTAVATIGALVAAGFAARGAFRLLDVERRRDAERAEAELQWQADLVAAWADREQQQRGRMPWTAEGAYVANGSPLPIYDVAVTWFYPDASGNLEFRCEQAIKGGLVPSGGGFYSLTNRGSGPPPHRRAVDVLDAHGAPVRAQEAEDLAQYRLSVAFTDTGGIRWLRGVNGLLRRDEDARTATTPARH